ncbi:MAG TPA: hypothetical protein VFX13_17785 [Gaiellales bacterium]|nr:hypothetical protein [Gaiellales bacterium]
MNAAATLTAGLDRVTAAVRAACLGTDLDDVAAQAAPLGDVVSRLGAIYDSLAEWLYADGCPGRHACDDFALAADHLHAAGAACRHAHQSLLEAIHKGGCR